MPYYFVLIFLTIFFTGCSHNATSLRAYASQKGLSSHIRCYEDICLQTFTLPFTKNKNLHIYIEGDGHSYANGRVADDPTPSNTFTLDLLLADQSDTNKIYIARPGQYVPQDKKGNPMNWCKARYSSQVLMAYHHIIDLLVKTHTPQHITLIGYSGGATIALLLGAHRKDITKIITFAGVLNHQEWTTHHGMASFAESLNIKDFTEALSSVFQLHYVGDDDPICPPHLAQSWSKCLNHTPKLQCIKSADHGSKNFIEIWKQNSVNS